MTQDEWKHIQWLKTIPNADPKLCIGRKDNTCYGTKKEHDMINILHKFNPHPNAPKTELKGIIIGVLFIGFVILMAILYLYVTLINA